MDYYFAKFKRTIVPRKTQVTGAMQLAKFQDCWNDVHNILMVEDRDRKALMHVEQTDIPERLLQMTDMLVDEEARQDDDATGACMEYGDCMEYLLKNQLLRRLVNVAEKSDHPVGIRGELIRTIANMVDLLGYWFLEHKEVHSPTIKLLRFCVFDDEQPSDSYHEDLVDLMYTICSKIHGRPVLLNIFFHDKRWLTTPQKARQQHREQQQQHPSVESSSGVRRESTAPAAASPSKEPEYEFLLFTYLLRFVHREGRTGDYARTGLLFIMEMATNQLGDFILESDFAMTMGAGLCALYSDLPRKLVIENYSETKLDFTACLLSHGLLSHALSPRNIPPELGLELSSSSNFRDRLSSFIKLFEFCQDVLIRCPNTKICFDLLESIRTPFLEKILYPTIEECSDRDGSSIATISYLDLILQILHHDELSSQVVGFLMNDGDGRFTLKDLIMHRLRDSSSQPTVIATLKLLKTLITRHCRYSLKLFTISPDDDSEQPLTTISRHLREIELYFSLISRVRKHPSNHHEGGTLAFGYEDYLQDIEAHIECDPCYQTMVGMHSAHDHSGGPPTPKSERRRSFKYGQRFDDDRETDTIQPSSLCKPSANLFKHHIKSTDPKDPLMNTLLRLLNPFLAQSPELNLVLMGVISALAICPYRSLPGWITFRESDRSDPDDMVVLTSQSGSNHAPRTDADAIGANDIYAPQSAKLTNGSNSHDNDDDDDDDRSIDYSQELSSGRMTARTQFKTYPHFFTLFQVLTQQIDCFRSEVDGFDELLEERRNWLMMGDSDLSNTAAASPPPLPPPPTMIPSSSSSTAALTGRRASLFPVENGGFPSPPTGRRASVMMRPSFSTTVNGTAAAAAAAAATAPAAKSAIYTLLTPPAANNTPNHTVTDPLSSPAIHTHARKTEGIRLQPQLSPRFVSDYEEPILDLGPEDENTYAPKNVNPSQARRADKSTEISLSMLLNNVIILEESIKELVAIMQVRRSLGIDEIRYT